MKSNHNKHDAFFWCKAWVFSFFIHGLLFLVIMMTFWSLHFQPNKDVFEIVVIPTILSAPNNTNALKLYDKKISISFLSLTPFGNPLVSLAFSKIQNRKEHYPKKATSSSRPRSSMSPITAYEGSESQQKDTNHFQAENINADVTKTNVSTQQKPGFFPNPQNAVLIYPKSAHKLKLCGSGIFRLYLSGNGKVKSIEFLSGDLPQRLKQSAEKTLRTWSFYGEVPGFVDVPIRYDAASSSSE